MQNYSLRDAFKSLDELNEEFIETSIVINGPLSEDFVEDSSDANDHKSANIRVFDIHWDSYDEYDEDAVKEADIPSEMYLELDEEDLHKDNDELEEIIANELSDQTGWLVNTFKYERLEPEKIIEQKEPLKEETFSLTTEEGLKDIEEFKEEDENEEPELTVVDTNADKIDEVASNEDAAGSFVFTCDKCGENIFRTLDELQTDGYERVDDTLFKLKNKDESQGEFYHCTKCGNDTFTGNKQLVLADVDAEVNGTASEEEITSEEDINVVDETSSEPDVTEDNTDIVVEESLDKKGLNESTDVTENDIVVEFLSDKIAKVLDDYGILYGDIVEYPEHKRCNIVGVNPEEWEELEQAIESELGLRVIVPEEYEEYTADEIEVFEESLAESLSAEKLSEFKNHEFFKDFNDNSIRKFISIYIDNNPETTDKTVTPEEVYNFMTEEGLGLFALDNIEALRFLTFSQLAKKDPKFIEACIKYYPEAYEDSNDDELLVLTFKNMSPEQLDDIRSNIKKIYFELQESLKKVKEGFVRKTNGTTECSTDGENWEECSLEEFEELKDGGYEDISEDLDEKEEEFDDVTITDIDENSIDKAISEKLSSIYENFGSYKTTSAFLKDVANRIVLEGKLTFTSNKEQDVKFILEALESDNGSIKFKLTCEDFEDINSELMTKLTEGLLEADESSEEDIVVNTPKAEIITVTSADELKDLYKKWAMTWEGLSEKSFDQAVDMCGGENAKGYLISGKLMNDVCHLSGDNAYPEDLNIFAVYPFKGLAMNYGARWMADIIDNNARRQGFHPFMDEQLDEASSAEKRAFLNGGKDLDNLVQGKAIARINNSEARNAAIAALKADRPEVAKQFYGDRKENQAERSAEKKFAKMQKAGLTEADVGDDWKYPEDCSSLEEYDSDAVSNIRYKADQGLFDAEEISENDERDYENDADGYIASMCARVAWGTGSGNPAENKLALDFVEKEYPSKVKVLRKYLGNSNSTVK